MAGWDESFDFVIVGSGGGGMVAALAAAEAGLKPVIIEKQQFVGGSTAMSGGIIWVPNNPLMRAEGVTDSYEEGLAYFDAVVGQPDQGSSMERREAFLTSGPEMLSFIQGKGVKLVRCEGYSDYYDNRKGATLGAARSRGCRGTGGSSASGRARSTRDGRGIGMVVKTNETRNLPVWSRSPHSFRTNAGGGTNVSRSVARSGSVHQRHVPDRSTDEDRRRRWDPAVAQYGRRRAGR